MVGKTTSSFGEGNFFRGMLLVLGRVRYDLCFCCFVWFCLSFKQLTFFICGFCRWMMNFVWSIGMEERDSVVTLRGFRWYYIYVGICQVNVPHVFNWQSCESNMFDSYGNRIRKQRQCGGLYGFSTQGGFCVLLFHLKNQQTLDVMVRWNALILGRQWWSCRLFGKRRCRYWASEHVSDWDLWKAQPFAEKEVE